MGEEEEEEGKKRANRTKCKWYLYSSRKYIYNPNADANCLREKEERVKWMEEKR
jgi:hypothetical protein